METASCGTLQHVPKVHMVSTAVERAVSVMVVVTRHVMWLMEPVQVVVQTGIYLLTRARHILVRLYKQE
jgi:hypothetical protein